MKKVNQKGFTLAEVLVVVAIIAILAAVAIPTFTKQIAEAKIGADLAYVSTQYSKAYADALFNSDTGTVTTLTDVDVSGRKHASSVTFVAGTDGASPKIKVANASDATIYKEFEVDSAITNVTFKLT